jgi:hypothetical protein
MLNGDHRRIVLRRPKPTTKKVLVVEWDNPPVAENVLTALKLCVGGQYRPFARAVIETRPVTK